MKKQKKYTYLLVLQGNYACGWEDLTCEDKADSGASSRIKANKKEYQENERGAYRIITRRQLNTLTNEVKQS